MKASILKDVPTHTQGKETIQKTKHIWGVGTQGTRTKIGEDDTFQMDGRSWFPDLQQH